MAYNFVPAELNKTDFVPGADTNTSLYFSSSWGFNFSGLIVSAFALLQQVCQHYFY
jgi:hypothetical protein